MPPVARMPQRVVGALVDILSLIGGFTEALGVRDV